MRECYVLNEGYRWYYVQIIVFLIKDFSFRICYVTLWNLNFTNSSGMICACPLVLSRWLTSPRILCFSPGHDLWRRQEMWSTGWSSTMCGWYCVYSPVWLVNITMSIIDGFHACIWTMDWAHNLFSHLSYTRFYFCEVQIWHIFSIHMDNQYGLHQTCMH